MFFSATSPADAQMAASGPAHLSLIYSRSPLLSTPQRVDDIDLLCEGAAADDDNKMVMADVFPFEDERPGAGGGMTRGGQGAGRPGPGGEGRRGGRGRGWIDVIGRIGVAWVRAVTSTIKIRLTLDNTLV